VAADIRSRASGGRAGRTPAGQAARGHSAGHAASPRSLGRRVAGTAGVVERIATDGRTGVGERIACGLRTRTDRAPTGRVRPGAVQTRRTRDAVVVEPLRSTLDGVCNVSPKTCPALERLDYRFLPGQKPFGNVELPGSFSGAFFAAACSSFLIKP